MGTKFFENFRQVIAENLETMAGVEFSVGNFAQGSNEFDATGKQGIASIVGIVGKASGRSMFFFPAETARRITELVLMEDIKSFKNENVFFTVNEINNVISGHCTTHLNKQHQLSLMLSPPSIFAGDSFVLTSPKLMSYEATVSFEGLEFLMNFAMEGGWPGE